MIEHANVDALSQALRANDLELVAWLCSRVAPQKIFGKSPLPLSQVVLISLVQQLSCDLNKVRACATILTVHCSRTF